MNATQTREISLAEAADLLPKRNGKPVSIPTLKRWIIKGYRGVRLGGRRNGGRGWFTTVAELEEFNRRCTERAGVEPARSGAETDRAVELAHRQLMQDGFYGRTEKAVSRLR